MKAHELPDICDLLTVKGVPVLRWGYEQAFATKIILTFKREPWGLLENYWAEQFGRSMDNKVTYEVDDGYNEVTFYITFHDNTVYVGLGIRPYGSGKLTEGESPKEKP